MKRKNMSTQELLGIKSFSPNGIRTDHGELVYFKIKPTNISVLSRGDIAQKIHRLTQLLSAQPDLEIVCTDARESFDDNKAYLDARIAAEQNPRVRSLLMRDRAMLDDMQLQMSTAREFLFVIRLRGASNEQVFADLNRIEKLIAEQGFDCLRAGRDDVKRILARYFGVGQSDAPIDDTDGESAVRRWMIPD